MYRSHLLKIAIIVHVFATSVIAQESLIGQAAPELGIEKFLQAPEGEKTLSALKGKVIVLEFWATWCGPCVAAIPHLNQLHDSGKIKKNGRLENDSRAQRHNDGSLWVLQVFEICRHIVWFECRSFL